jgi:hypothetical protein
MVATVDAAQERARLTKPPDISSCQSLLSSRSTACLVSFSSHCQLFKQTVLGPGPGLASDSAPSKEYHLA